MPLHAVVEPEQHEYQSRAPVEDFARTADANLAGKDLAFKDLGLKVGDRMVIEPPAKLGEQPGVVKLIGW